MRAEQSIVANALRLWSERSNDLARQILDDVMSSCHDDDLEFAFDYDDLRPPHPFAELLRRAFAPELDPTILLISTLAAEFGDHNCPQFKSAQDEWHAAIMRFADRYGIWSPEPSCRESPLTAAAQQLPLI